MIQFSRPRKAYRSDDKFRQGLAHQIDAREAFAKPPLASESKLKNKNSKCRDITHHSLIV